MPPPSIGSKYRSDFIVGVAKKEEEFIMILNMDLIFSLDELHNVKETTNKIKEKAEKVPA